MEYRKYTRYGLNEPSEPEELSLEIELDPPVLGKPSDISLSGLGFEFSGLTFLQMEAIKSIGSFFLKLNFGSAHFLVSVSKVWEIADQLDGKFRVRGGVRFDLMSGEDRVKLSGFIEKIRNSSYDSRS